MKHETANLLLGLGIGAVVGVAVGYLMVADNRKKLSLIHILLAWWEALP